MLNTIECSSIKLKVSKSLRLILKVGKSKNVLNISSNTAGCEYLLRAVFSCDLSDSSSCLNYNSCFINLAALCYFCGVRLFLLCLVVETGLSVFVKICTTSTSVLLLIVFSVYSTKVSVWRLKCLLGSFRSMIITPTKILWSIVVPLLCKSLSCIKAKTRFNSFELCKATVTRNSICAATSDANCSSNILLCNLATSKRLATVVFEFRVEISYCWYRIAPYSFDIHFNVVLSFRTGHFKSDLLLMLDSMEIRISSTCGTCLALRRLSTGEYRLAAKVSYCRSFLTAYPSSLIRLATSL